MVLTERDRRVVADVASFRVVTREQLQRLGHFRSKTRANATLARLVRFGYVQRRGVPALAGSQRGLYFVGPAGAALLTKPAEGRRIRHLSDLFLTHELLVNDVRIAFVATRELRVGKWLTDEDLRPLKLPVVPDAYAEYERSGKAFAVFVELDRGTESLLRWRTKVSQYVQLASSGRFRAVFERNFFRVLAVAPSATRLTSLRRTTAQVTDKIFWFADSAELGRLGPLAPIWRRPTGDTLHSLTEA
jgi:hypothetical protein